MKVKIGKKLFYVSFLPIITIAIISSYYAIFGYDVYTWILPEYVKTIYGIDAFLEVFTWYILKLWFIPVLPICFGFQLVYIIVTICKKHRNLINGVRNNECEKNKIKK